MVETGVEHDGLFLRSKSLYKPEGKLTTLLALQFEPSIVHKGKLIQWADPGLLAWL